MLKENEIDPKTLEQGDIVQFENKYHVACIVEVLNKKISNDGDNITIEMKTLDVIFGDPDDQFKISHTLKDEYSHYVKSKFKKAGSMTEYVNSTEYSDHSQKIKQLRKKYGTKL